VVSGNILDKRLTRSILEFVKRFSNACLETPPLSVVPEKEILLNMKKAAAFFNSSKSSILFFK